MAFLQELVLIVFSGVMGMVLGILGMTLRIGPRLTKMETQLTSASELRLSRGDLSEFENRFLERLNGRYLHQDLAQALIKKSDDQWLVMNARVLALEAV